MPRISVAVPQDDQIDTYLLARRISYAFYPLAAVQRGERIVTKKLSKLSDKFRQHLFDSAAHPDQTQADAEKKEPVSVAKLTEKDRELLRTMLVDLPPLHSQMSLNDRDEFYMQWNAHPLAPDWWPKLPSEQDEVTARLLASEVSERHLKQMATMVQKGTLKAFDTHHLPSRDIGLNIYIRQSDAIAYLEAHDLDAMMVEELVAPPPPTRSRQSFKELELLPIEPRDLPPDSSSGIVAVQSETSESGDESSEIYLELLPLEPSTRVSLEMLGEGSSGGVSSPVESGRYPSDAIAASDHASCSSSNSLGSKAPEESIVEDVSTPNTAEESPRPYIRWNDEEVERMVQLVRKKGWKATARDYGVEVPTLKRTLKRKGVEKPKLGRADPLSVWFSSRR